MSLPNPLDRAYTGLRILSDRGIRAALEQGLIAVYPEVDFSEDERFQPATLDVKIKRIEDLDINYPFIDEFPARMRDPLTIPPGSKANISLTELIYCTAPRFLYPLWEGRSSVRRLGLYNANARYFFMGPKSSQIEMGNFSQNAVTFSKGNRIAQLFFVARPFSDSYPFEDEHETGEKIRALDMGIQIIDSESARSFVKKGDLAVYPKLTQRYGRVLVHASNTAYRLRKLDEPFYFQIKDNYSQEQLLQPIDISDGYEIKPYEHIIIETEESFELSDKVGIWFWDNLLSTYRNSNKSFAHMNRIGTMRNIRLTNLPDGWIDPGYKGGFSRQPKWISEARVGRIVHPGDILGSGAIYYFPNGVANPYGTIKGNQWQETVETKVV